MTPRRFAAAGAIALVAAGMAGAADFTVVQKNREFSVAEIEVRVGDRIVFFNIDSVTHNVYSETKGAEFEIELQPPGRSDSVRFSNPGPVDVSCAIHPSMRLREHVKL